MDYIPPELSKETKEGLQNEYKGALNQSPGLLAQDSMTGVGAARDFENRSDGFNQTTSYGDPGLSAAIKGREKANYDGQYEQMEMTAKTNAQNRYFKRLQQATQLASEENQVNQQIALAKWQAKQRKKAARAQILGTVLGVAGAVGGAVAGGPTGAVAGMTAGQGVGGMAANAESGGGL